MEQLPSRLRARRGPVGAAAACLAPHRDASAPDTAAPCCPASQVSLPDTGSKASHTALFSLPHSPS